MNIQDKAKMAVNLYFDGFSAKDAVQKVLNIDGNSVYDEKTGNTVCQDITTITPEQTISLLR